MPVIFSPEVRARAAKQTVFDEVELLYTQAAALRIPRVSQQTMSPVANVPIKVFALLQSGLRRVLDLTEGVVREVNAGSFTPVFVLARASVETGCLLCDFSARVETVVKAQNPAAVEEFNERIVKALLGVKSAEWKPHPDAPEALNVLTIIDNLTKQLPQLRSLYDTLSEFAHPNYDGMVGAYTPPESDGTVFEDRPALLRQHTVELAVKGAGLGLLLTTSAFKEYVAAHKEFVRLCEEHVHVRGEWPAGVPYPR